MSHINNLVIIGTSHHNTLSMIRCFGQEGLKPYVIEYGEGCGYIEKSNYLSGYEHVNCCEDAVDSLVVFSQNSNSKPVVISCADEVSMILDKRYEELCSVCHFFNAGEKGRVSYFMDKQVQTILARECGFSTPWSFECLPNEVPFDRVNYPCIIKPKESVHGGKRISICNTIEEVKASLGEFDKDYAVLVQQYIRGIYELVVIGVTVNGQSIIPGFVKKHRDYKGATTFSTTYPASELSGSIVSSAKKLIDHIGYEGLWGIECIKRGDDFFFIELNLRNDATTYSMAVAGVNLPLLYYHAVIENDTSFDISKKIEVIDSMVEFEDFNFVLKRKISLRRWMREKRGCRCRYFFDKNDLKPYLAKVKVYFLWLLNRITH